MISFLLILLLQAFPFQTQKEYLVKNFTVEDGLPVNTVNGIVQDDEGYLYFSTLDGLARYDGYEFNVYNSGNTKGLFTNRIGGMMKAESNEIWMIHPNGTITRKSGNNFTTYSNENEDFQGEAGRMLEAKNGDVWISTTEGIFRFDTVTDSFIPQADPLLKTKIWAIESVPGGGIVALNNNGLIFWKDGDASVLLETDDFPIPAENVLHIKQFTVNDVWVIGGSGLFRFSLYSKEIDYVYHTKDPTSTVWNLHPDPNGSYIINSSEGFFSWDQVTKYVRKIPPDISTTTDRINLVFRGADNVKILLGDDEVLIDGQKVFETDEIQSGFIDNEGSLWISTLREGIYQIRKSDFTNITSEQIRGFENIYPVIQTDDGAVWAGSFVNGIYRISNQQIQNWTTSNSRLPGNLCRFLFEDSDGTIYASMWGEGLWTFTGSNWTQVHEVPDAIIEAMHRDGNDRLFIGTTENLMVRENGEYRRFSSDVDPVFQSVRVIRESRNGTLYMGTNGNGLKVLNSGIQRNYTTQNSHLSSDAIRDIFVQSSDTLWLATENLGLDRVILDDSLKIQSVTNITTRDGLIKNSLHRIIEVPEGQLWISSNGGIMRISKRELNRYADDEISELTVLGFDEKNGMINREANGGVQTAGLLTTEQKLWFPNQKGITIIDPLQFSDNHSRTVPHPLIEEIVLPDTTIFTSNTSDIDIPSGERNVRIKFSAPNFSSPDHIQFRYKLEGLNQNWENGNQSHEAVLTNIPPGTHEFQVMTVQAGGVSEPATASVFITIPPYFYETTWFFISITILGGLVIFGGIKYRTRVLGQREKELQKRVDQQTEELKKAAEQKSRFFSSITHELKTPLSLISGPLGDLLDQPSEVSDSAVQKLQMMERNNRRLQNLVDEILDVTRLNADAVKLTLQPVKLAGFTRQIAGQFHSKLLKENIKLIFHSDPLNELIYVDPAAWERIIINLMNNAIKFSPNYSSIYLTISNEENHVLVRLRDEGIGIEEKDTAKIFDYLYQAQGEKAAEGTGIGLYLVKGLVEHMGGNIRVQSGERIGAEFIITLKKGFEHFQESDTVVHEPFLNYSPDNPQPAAVTVPPQSKNDTDNLEHVFVVEDNDDFREYIQSMLSEKYRVTLASEGKEAFEMLETTSPDLIISDVMMPRMDGLEFVNNLRKKNGYEHLPVIFLSAKDMDADKEAGLSTGADIYLTKPLKRSLLLSQVAAVLRREKVLKKESPYYAENEDDFVQQVRTIIYRQLANQALNVDMLADALFMSRRKLYDLWKKNDKISLNEFIKKTRLEEAKILLENQGFNVKETALAVGYSNTTYFSTTFKKEFGVSPSEVMK